MSKLTSVEARKRLHQVATDRDFYDLLQVIVDHHKDRLLSSVGKEMLRSLEEAMEAYEGERKA